MTPFELSTKITIVEPFPNAIVFAVYPDGSPYIAAYRVRFFDSFRWIIKTCRANMYMSKINGHFSSLEDDITESHIFENPQEAELSFNKFFN